MLTTEAAAALVAIASAYWRTGRAVPPHLQADLEDIARCDSMPVTLRNQCERLLREEAA